MAQIHEAELVLTPEELEIKKSEEAIENATNAVKALKYLDELKENRAFIEVVMKGFVIAEPQRALRNLVESKYLTSDEEKANLDTITAIRGLNEYFNMIEAKAHGAQRLIENEEERIRHFENGGIM